jgi:hypothetical protein
VKKQGEILTNLSGRVLFIVLFSLIVYLFFNKSAKQSPDGTQCQALSLISDNSVQAIPSDNSKIPSYKTSWICNQDHSNFKPFDLKIDCDNKNIAQKYILLKQTHLKIKPITELWFYHAHSSIKNEEPPVLS